VPKVLITVHGSLSRTPVVSALGWSASSAEEETDRQVDPYYACWNWEEGSGSVWGRARETAWQAANRERGKGWLGSSPEELGHACQGSLEAAPPSPSWRSRLPGPSWAVGWVLHGVSIDHTVLGEVYWVSPNLKVRVKVALSPNMAAVHNHIWVLCCASAQLLEMQRLENRGYLSCSDQHGGFFIPHTMSMQTQEVERRGQRSCFQQPVWWFQGHLTLGLLLTDLRSYPLRWVWSFCPAPCVAQTRPLHSPNSALFIALSSSHCLVPPSFSLEHCAQPVDTFLVCGLCPKSLPSELSCYLSAFPSSLWSAQQPEHTFHWLNWKCRGLRVHGEWSFCGVLLRPVCGLLL